VVSLLGHDSKLTFGKKCWLYFIVSRLRRCSAMVALVIKEEKQ
jgi:hypothetical protein